MPKDSDGWLNTLPILGFTICFDILLVFSGKRETTYDLKGKRNC